MWPFCGGKPSVVSSRVKCNKFISTPRRLPPLLTRRSYALIVVRGLASLQPLAVSQVTLVQSVLVFCELFDEAVVNCQLKADRHA
jgi:hypothetical protein